jgi:hypothetical protein
VTASARPVEWTVVAEAIGALCADGVDAASDDVRVEPSTPPGCRGSMST